MDREFGFIYSELDQALVYIYLFIELEYLKAPNCFIETREEFNLFK